jgi:hypothetical protein
MKNRAASMKILAAFLFVDLLDAFTGSMKA